MTARPPARPRPPRAAPRLSIVTVSTLTPSSGRSTATTTRPWSMSSCRYDASPGAETMTSASTRRSTRACGDRPLPRHVVAVAGRDEPQLARSQGRLDRCGDGGEERVGQAGDDQADRGAGLACGERPGDLVRAGSRAGAPPRGPAPRSPRATPYSSFSAREAVLRLTPARAATSASVGRAGRRHAGPHAADRGRPMNRRRTGSAMSTRARRPPRWSSTIGTVRRRRQDRQSGPGVSGTKLGV